jgi:hypothetical protein
MARRRHDRHPRKGHQDRQRPDVAEWRRSQIELGAMRTDVLRIFIQSCAISVAIGAMLGMLGSLAAGHALSHVVQSGYATNLLPLLLGMLVLALAALILVGRQQTDALKSSVGQSETG